MSRGVFFSCILQWGEHYAALSRLAVGQTLMVNQLVDMEWKFGGKTRTPRGPAVVSPLTLPADIHEHRSCSPTPISIACAL